MTESKPRFAVPAEVTSFVGGSFVAAGKSDGLPLINPATEDRISILHEADGGQVDAAVAAARSAFADGRWSNRTVEARQAILIRIAETIEEHANELAYLECLNAGLPMRDIRARHVPRAAYNFRFFAEVIGQAAGETYTQNPNYLTYVTREPVGVAALLGPWNAPLALTSMKIAAAIAFGNSCVVKPSEVTPLAVARLMSLLAEAGLPEGVVNMINGRGPVTGQALVGHSGIDVVSFTGGTATGRKIAETAGRGLKPVTMELGGKSANIIFESADIDRALDGALIGIFSNNGQQCLAGSRILVQGSIADDFIGRFVERARKIEVGDPMAGDTVIGPLVSGAHRDRVLSYADIAVNEGAELLTGGHAHPDFAEGYYIEPTAVLAPSNDIRVCREEIFGPFSTFLIFDKAEDAARIANDSDYGLVAYIWSDDLPTVMQTSRAIRAGTIWVNTPMMRELRAPFGGMNDSGVGREGADDCLRFYTEAKTTSVAAAPFPIAKLDGKK